MNRTTAEIEQIHSFWMTTWNYLSQFRHVLDIREVQKAIISVNNPKRHLFWGKLKEALEVLVKMPKEKESKRFHSRGNISPMATSEWLAITSIDVPQEIKKRLAFQQLSTFHGTNHVRLVYDADDLYVLGNIARIFPGLADTPFGRKDGDVTELRPYSLPRIEQFVEDADAREEDPGIVRIHGNAIIESNAENIFTVQGQSGPFMVSIRKKLNTWRMRLVEPGCGFRGQDVYVFI